MDRQRYLKETSEALRETEERRRDEREARQEQAGANGRGVGDRALERLIGVLGTSGLKCDGERWQCPSCRSQDRAPEFVLEIRVVGRHVELKCSLDCRPNTIRALLGAPPYFPTLGPRSAARFPFR